MKPSRFTTALLNKKPGFAGRLRQWLHDVLPILIAVIMTITVFAITLVVLACFRPAFAADTDWHDDSVSRQIQTNARAEARKIWREEHGDLQPNLTPMAEAELVRYTAQKQVEIDRTLGATK